MRKRLDLHDDLHDHQEVRAWHGTPWHGADDVDVGPPKPPDEKHKVGALAALAPKDAALLARVGLVLGRFSPPHVGHVHLVEQAFSQCGMLYVRSPPKAFAQDPKQLHQYGMVRAFQPYGDVSTMGLSTDPPSDIAHWAAKVRADLPHVTTLFSSDTGAAADLANALGVEHVVIDAARARFPVRGTDIRADIFARFRDIAPAARGLYAVNVAVVGVEGAGKSTLVRELAVALEASVVSDPLLEAAQTAQAVPPVKAFLDAINTSYKRRDDAAKTCTSGVVVADDSALVTYAWMERLGIAPAERAYQVFAEREDVDVWLYCEPDFPYEGVTERHDPVARAAFDQTLRALFAAPLRKHRTVFVRGEGQARVQIALDAIAAARERKREQVTKALA